MNILIIGANGFTGRHILTHLIGLNKYNLYGCSLRDDIAPAKGYHFIKSDIEDEEKLTSLFTKVMPDVVINTAALSVPDFCETHHKEAFNINSKAVENMARLCEKHQCRFIHLSTDFVFDGKADHLYTESDEPQPVNIYGMSKLAGEEAIEKVTSNYAIARVVVVYGKHLPGQHGNIVQLVANKLRNNEKMRVVNDQWRTPTYVGDIAIAMELLINSNENGIFHICGKDYLSIADIAECVAVKLSLNKELIERVSTKEMNEATPRPQYSGLSIEKALHVLGYSPRSLMQGIADTFAEN